MEAQKIPINKDLVSTILSQRATEIIVTRRPDSLQFLIDDQERRNHISLGFFVDCRFKVSGVSQKLDETEYRLGFASAFSVLGVSSIENSYKNALIILQSLIQKEYNDLSSAARDGNSNPNLQGGLAVSLARVGEHIRWIGEIKREE